MTTATVTQPTRHVRNATQTAKGATHVEPPYTSSVELIDADTAAKYLQKNSGNRRLRRATARYFAALMKKGAWVHSPDAIAFDELDRLINGQHRLTGIVLSGVPQWCTVVRGLSLDSFPHIDTGNRRGLEDVLHIMDVPLSHSVAPIAKRVASYVKAGYLNASIAGKGHNGSPGTALYADRADELEVATDLDGIGQAAEFAATLAKGGRRIGLTPTAIGFVCLLYRSWHPGIDSFLSRAANLTSDNRGDADPARRLSLRLLDSVQGLENERLSPSARVGYVVLAANADFRGKTLSKLQWTRKDHFPQPLVHVAPEWATRLGWDRPRGAKEESDDLGMEES